MSDDEMKALIAEARESALAARFEWHLQGSRLIDHLADALEAAQETIAAFIIGGAVQPADDVYQTSIAHPAEERAWEYRRVDPRGFVRPVVFDVLPALDEGWAAERRAIGPWSPVPTDGEGQ